MEVSSRLRKFAEEGVSIAGALPWFSVWSSEGGDRKEQSRKWEGVTSG